MKVVDAHLHIGLRGMDIAALKRYLDGGSADKVWLLTWDELSPKIPERYIALSVDEMLDAFSAFGDRVVPMFAPDPQRDDAVALLTKYASQGVRGCAELKVTESWDSYRMTALLSKVNELKMPLIFHMEQAATFYSPKTDAWISNKLTAYSRPTKWRGFSHRVVKSMRDFGLDGFYRKHVKEDFFPGYLNSFQLLEKRLKEFPDIKFIGHASMFWKGIDSNWQKEPLHLPRGSKVDGKGVTCRLLEEYPNCFIDISAKSGWNALNRDATFTNRFLNEYSSKILYGTDNYSFPLLNLVRKNVTDSVRLKEILAGNAERLLS